MTIDNDILTDNDAISNQKSKSAEQRVLGSCLLYGLDAFRICKKRLNLSDFYFAEHRHIWKAFSKLDKSDTPIDILRVEETLGNNLSIVGGRQHLLTISNLGASDVILKSYIDEVKKLSATRKKISDLRQEINSLENGDSEINVDVLSKKITCLADVQPEEVQWLWPPYIALKKLTLVEGNPGGGKTFFSLQVASNVSKGLAFLGPDGLLNMDTENEPANVLYLSCEDGLGDTLRPRLDAVGADVTRIFALREVTLAEIDILRDAMIQHSPRLVIVDPIQGFLGNGVDMNKAEQIRPLLSGLGALAEEFNCAVLIVRHLTKSTKDHALYRGLGSIDFAAAARSVLLIGDDPEDQTKRCIVQTKNSLAKAGPSLSFTINDGRFEWCGVSKLSSDEILNPKNYDSEEKSAIEEAKDFLREALANGSGNAGTLYQEARKLRINDRTLRRARTELDVQYQKIGREWFWILS